MWGIEAAGRSKAMSIAVATPAEMNQEALRFHRFTVAEYQRMAYAGAFDKVRVELLDGWIVDKKMHNPPHDFTFNRLNGRLIRMLTGEWVVRNQSTILLRRSVPEPDLVVARGPEETYAERHPGPKDTVLVVEVSDATLSSDRGFKGALYARARIPIYWIVNLVNHRVEVYTDPKAGRSPAYRARSDCAVDESVPLVLDGREIARIPVREILP
jgi:Uma2 family endonuclease